MDGAIWVERLPDPQIELELQTRLPLVEGVRDRRLQPVWSRLPDDAVRLPEELEQVWHEGGLPQKNVHVAAMRGSGETEDVLPASVWLQSCRTFAPLEDGANPSKG